MHGVRTRWDVGVGMAARPEANVPARATTRARRANLKGGGLAPRRRATQAVHDDYDA